MTSEVVLKPAELIALTVALAQVKRGDPVPRNTAAMCVLALARVTGKYDWTKVGEDESVSEARVRTRERLDAFDEVLHPNGRTSE